MRKLAVVIHYNSNGEAQNRVIFDNPASALGRNEPALPVLFFVAILYERVERADNPGADRISQVFGNGEEKIVPCNMPDKSFVAEIEHNITNDSSGQLHDLITVVVTVVIVVGFEIIQIGIANGKRRPKIELALDFLLDNERAGKLSRRVQRNIAPMSFDNAVDADSDQPFYPLAVDEFLGAVFVGSNDRFDWRLGVKEDDRYDREKHVSLDRAKQVQLQFHIRFASQDYGANRKLLADAEEGIETGEEMKGDILLAVELPEVEIEIDPRLLDGEVVDQLSRIEVILCSRPVLEDDTSGVRQ